MADDFFGPASDLAVTARPPYSPQTARLGGAPTFFKRCSSPGADDGTLVDAEWLNHLIANLDAIRVGAGITSGDVAPTSDQILLESILALIDAALPSLAGYVLKAGDTMTGRLSAPGFRAAKGYPTGDSSSVGFAFGTDGDTGLFADGSSYSDTTLIEARINGNTKLWVAQDGRVAAAAAPYGPLDLVNLGYLQAHSGLLGKRTITASGTYTKTAGTTKALVFATGGGGAGGYDGSSGSSTWAGGGGAGATAISLVDLSAVSTVACTVGAGGAGYVGYIGNNGGTTAFGAYLSAGGGRGGGISGGGYRYGGAGGVATVGDWLLKGGGGGGGGAIMAMGGASFWGGGGAGGAGSVGASTDGMAPGSGGAAGAPSGGTNGSGADGCIFILEFA